MEETVVYEKPAESSTDTSSGARVILFNDDWHTFDDVIQQLIKAIHCTAARAERMAWTVHTEGKCEVYHGPVEECLSVSAILEEIELKTRIDFS